MLGLLEKKDEQLCVGGEMLFRISGILQVYLAVVKNIFVGFISHAYRTAFTDADNAVKNTCTVKTA